MKTAEQHNAAFTGFVKLFRDDLPKIEIIRRQKRGERFGKQRSIRRKRR